VKRTGGEFFLCGSIPAELLEPLEFLKAESIAAARQQRVVMIQGFIGQVKRGTA
jgi:hypothetical protein